MIRDEIRCVRSLKSGGQWIEMRQRLPGVIFEEDDVTVMNDIADTRNGQFARHGINTVLDVKLMTKNKISVIVADKAFRVSEHKLRELQKQADQAKKGSVPSRIYKDHRQEDNPYLSRFWHDSWKDEIGKCSSMSGSICVTTMIHHMVDEVNRVMKGTNHEGEGQFYHDTLTLMTCEKSKAYMLQHDLLKYWLLPLENLQKGTRYHNYIPGDSPEMMPLDETLHMDIHACARYHVAITSHLPHIDQNKFSLCPPKEISRAYLCIVDPVTGGAASSNRIVQDCEKWIRSLEKIRSAGGNMVEGFGWNGHRRGNQGRRGGSKIKKTTKSSKLDTQRLDRPHTTYVARACSQSRRQTRKHLHIEHVSTEHANTWHGTDTSSGQHGRGCQHDAYGQ
jgi:hypothetical protein